MENITRDQQRLLKELTRQDPSLVVRWDEEHGVASSLRGALWPRAEGEPEEALKGFLDKYSPLLGPRELEGALTELRRREDDLGWSHFLLQHRLQQNGHRLEVYGCKLAAHFDDEQELTEVQSSLWRDLAVDAEPEVAAEDLRVILLERIRDLPGFEELQERLGEREPTFPITDKPRLVIFPWESRFPLAWLMYGYSDYEPPSREGEAEGDAGARITFGQIVIHAVTGERILFSPGLITAETPTVGTGLAVTPLTGTHTERTLDVVQVDNTSTHRLKDTTHQRSIITYDANRDSSYGWSSTIGQDINSDALPVSEDDDGDKDWDRQPATSAVTDRTKAQLPEVDAHFFAKQQYEWYEALGRTGWDDGQYNDPPVPTDQPVRVLTHCPTTLDGWMLGSHNAYCFGVMSGGKWTYWLGFMDGSTTGFDYMAGSPFIVAHEYQHAITHFSFEDADGAPGLTYEGWLGAVHEGLSDVFGILTTGEWLPCRAISHASPAQVFRNLVYPRDANANNPNMLDHFADCDPTAVPEHADFYRYGTILAHAAYFLGKGGVHHRQGRGPLLIPVYSIGQEELSGLSIMKAARIWYRALDVYCNTITGLIENDTAFRVIRDACVSAASDLYGTDSKEYRNTVLALYAVGLHPENEDYGADVTFLQWGVRWDLSRNYVGLTSPDYSSLDLFINNGGASEWNAIVNVTDAQGNPTEFENNVFCRVRNVGDVDAEDVKVSFQYAEAGTAIANWLPVTDKDGNVQELYLGTLAAGASNFPDSDQDNPPPEAGRKWYIPPLAPGSTVDHFCLKAVVTASNDVNVYNNEVQSNIAYLAYTPDESSTITLTAANPYEDTRIPLELDVETALPAGWGVRMLDEREDVILAPGERREFRVQVGMPAGADRKLGPPLDGDFIGEVSADVAERVRGVLTLTVLGEDDAEGGHELKGRFSGRIAERRVVSGMFEGRIDLRTGELEGRVRGDLPAAGDERFAKYSLKGHLRPWRRISVSQFHGGERLGGVTLQIQVPWHTGPFTEQLPPTRTTVEI